VIDLLPTGHARIATAAQLARAPRLDLISWCHATARYTIVTLELLEWLSTMIAGRWAIEICAGQGDLGYHLGVPMSDSAMQTGPEMQVLYKLMMQQTPTDPPPDVERMDAIAAVHKYRPRVVIGSWVTQLYKDGDEGPPKIGSSIYGVDEFEILRVCETYIHIGNLAVHKDKRILELPHDEYEFPWLWSRAQRPELNQIWVWNRPQIAAVLPPGDEPPPTDAGAAP